MNSSSNNNNNKLGTWFDSILDLFVWVGFPKHVPEHLLLVLHHQQQKEQNSTHQQSSSSSSLSSSSFSSSLSTFLTRAIMNNKQPANWYERYMMMDMLKMNNNNNNKASSSSSSINLIDPAIPVWCDGIRHTLETVLVRNDDDNNNNFDEIPLDVCGKSSQDRSSYLVPSSSSSSSLFSTESFRQVMPDSNKSNNNSSEIVCPPINNTSSSNNNNQRNVSAVVSLIVDGANNNTNNSRSNRLAKEVFGSNTNAVIQILSSIGLIGGLSSSFTNNNDQEEGSSSSRNNNNNNNASSSSVNGLLWTTLGSPQLQRCVLLQAAIFYVLKKLCGLNFVVDETTNNWKCDFSSSLSNQQGSMSSAEFQQRQILLSVSVISGLIALSCLEEDCWYFFPQNNNSNNNNNNNNNNNIAIPSLLHVLSVLGFVSLARSQHDDPQQRIPLFRVLPEFRDAMLCTGAVDLKPSLINNTSNNNKLQNFFSSSSSSGSSSSSSSLMMMSSAAASAQKANQDCVIVETNFRVYVHLVPVRNPYHNQKDSSSSSSSPSMIISHRGETLLAVLRTFLEQEELVSPIFAVFRLTRESFLRAIQKGLTTDSIIRFLDAKSHPMAVQYYSSSSSNNNNNNNNNSSSSASSGVPRALRDQMLTWGKEAERISLKHNSVLLTFPTSNSSQKLLAILAKRLNGADSFVAPQKNNNNNTEIDSSSSTTNTKKSFEKMSVDELMDSGALPASSVFTANGFQVVISEKLWPLISDLLPAAT